MSVEIDGDITIGDLDAVDEDAVDEYVDEDDTHPFDVGPQGPYVTILHDTGDRLIPVTLSVEATLEFADAAQYAADQAAQYKREKQNQNVSTNGGSE